MTRRTSTVATIGEPGRAVAAHHTVGPRSYTPLTVAVGDTIAVRLVDASAGGFVWKVTELPLQLEAREKAYEEAAEPGAAVFKVLGFRALAPGFGRLVLVLARPWEGYPVRQIQMQVTVQEPTGSRR